MEDFVQSGGVDIAVGDHLEDLRKQIKQTAANNRRLTLENQRLQAELRRANAHDAIADQLHQAHVAAHRPRETSPPQPSADEGCSAVADLQRSLAEAEAASRKAAMEVEDLRLLLCSDEDMGMLRSEVGRMREITERPDQAPMADELLLRPHSETIETVDQSDQKANVHSAVRENLKSDSSFEMLATIAEADISEEKKALQMRLAELSRELRTLLADQRSSAALSMDKRRSRRLQQADAIAAGLHHELRRRGNSGASSPRSLRSDLSLRGPSDIAAGNSPLTQRSSLPSSLQGTPSVLSSTSKASTARAQKLDRGIQQLSRRFAMRAAAHS
jgi:hypothetical protein